MDRVRPGLPVPVRAELPPVWAELSPVRAEPTSVRAEPVEAGVYSEHALRQAQGGPSTGSGRTDLLFDLCPSPFGLRPTPFRLRPTPFRLNPTPFGLSLSKPRFNVSKPFDKLRANGVEARARAESFIAQETP